MGAFHLLLISVNKNAERSDGLQKNTSASTPHRRNISLHRKSAFDLAMTLIFDLWPWKLYQQCPLT